MDFSLKNRRNVFELMLILVTGAMAALYFAMGPFRVVTLHLFFLPIVLSGYYSGRFSSGVLALFSAVCVTIATFLLPASAASLGLTDPVITTLVLAVWSSVLGLAAILTGTLCDERAENLQELQRAYVGVAEVLSTYVRGNHPGLDTRTGRVAELSTQVAEQMGLPAKDVDHVRVAALLQDLANLEISTKVISRAVGSLEGDPRLQGYTFMGSDLVFSLGEVLEGALPLLVSQDDAVADVLEGTSTHHTPIPTGAQIIRVARQFDRLTRGTDGEVLESPEQALQNLRRDPSFDCPHVIDALDETVRANTVHDRTTAALIG